MRIVLHGQQAFGQAVLEKLLKRGEDVVAVCCAPTKEGKPEDVVASYKREKGLPVHQPASETRLQPEVLLHELDDLRTLASQARTMIEAEYEAEHNELRAKNREMHAEVATAELRERELQSTHTREVDSLQQQLDPFRE